MNASASRIYAIVLRNLYVLKGSWPRLLEMAYWPALQVLIWGFTSQFFAGNSSWLAQAGGVLIAGVLLWDVTMRGQIGVSIGCMEELWSRNLGHLFITPLRPGEWMAALMVMSLIRTALGIAPAALIAWACYDFSIFELGPPLLAFFSLLMVMGWAIGLCNAAMLIRYGLGSETLAWVGPFALAPLSAVYYPVETLPGWLRPIALCLPSSHVFEGMRRVMVDHVFDWGHFTAALALDGVLIAGSAALFLGAFNRARVLGRLLQGHE